jgi:hypothetical protein
MALSRLQRRRRDQLSDKTGFNTESPAIVGVHVDYRDVHKLLELVVGEGRE